MVPLVAKLNPKPVVKRMKNSAVAALSRVQMIRREEEGQSLVEYALIIALISLVIVAASEPVRAALQNIFQKIVDALTTRV